MQTIYKIGFLIIILLIINHLHPLKKNFNLNNLIEQFNKTKNIKQINMIHKYINNLIIKNIDYNELINYTWTLKPVIIDELLEKSITEYILNLFKNPNFNGYNIKIINKSNYYITFNGSYIPNINFKLNIKSKFEEYIYFMDIELFIHNNNSKIDIVNLKINNITNNINDNDINIENILTTENDNSVFLNVPNIDPISEDSLIPTINNID